MVRWPHSSSNPIAIKSMSTGVTVPILACAHWFDCYWIAWGVWSTYHALIWIFLSCPRKDWLALEVPCPWRYWRLLAMSMKYLSVLITQLLVWIIMSMICMHYIPWIDLGTNWQIPDDVVPLSRIQSNPVQSSMLMKTQYLRLTTKSLLLTGKAILWMNWWTFMIYDSLKCDTAPCPPPTHNE